MNYNTQQNMDEIKEEHDTDVASSAVSVVSEVSIDINRDWFRPTVQFVKKCEAEVSHVFM
jgi:hypothetical protein